MTKNRAGFAAVFWLTFYFQILDNEAEKSERMKLTPALAKVFLISLSVFPNFTSVTIAVININGPTVIKLKK